MQTHTTIDRAATAAPLYVPAEWQAAHEAPERDAGLDLLRGLAMVILVVNHTQLESVLSYATGSVLSAAEVLVAVSGVVVGMVFGRRWLSHGARATARLLLLRSRKLYLASVIVVALVGLARLLPGLATEALTVSPNVQPAVDAYNHDGVLPTLGAVVTLAAGPWQFSILGFFIASLALAPLLLWALARGWWLPLIAGSWIVFALGRELQINVLPAQSERPFSLLVWQALFVNGMVLGWHRRRVAAALAARRRVVVTAVLAAAAVFAALQTLGPVLVETDTWARWNAEHFDKGSLDVLRIAAMCSMAGALYLLLQRHAETAARVLGPILLPLGRKSFYVFIMHVFLCLALATALAAAGSDGLGLFGNALLQAGCIALLCLMVRRRFLFRYVPR